MLNQFFSKGSFVLRLSFILAAVATLWFVLFPSPTGVIISESKPISHAAWTSLLQNNVAENGMVNYQGFIDSKEELNNYLDIVSSNHPNLKNWNKNQIKAYWINAYNAFTVKLIIDNYPIKSIKELGGIIYRVNTSWDKKFIFIENQEYGLNNIEHNILRGSYTDPRIHFTINCASLSCPKLLDVAYTADYLDKQLDQAAVRFINDQQRNKIKKEKVELSRIFKWFKSDFKDNGSLIDFINTYSEIEIDSDGDVDFLEYDWRLNDVND